MQDLVDYLALARQHNASDLHLTVGAPPTVRVFGALRPLTEQALGEIDCRDLIYGVLKETQRSRLEQEWEIDFSLEVESLGRFRANARFSLGSVEANFRFIPQTVDDLTTLGHSPKVEDWCREKAGLVLVTGASGSGKSTTLASMTQTIARQRCANIVSIEDPVEFVFPQGHSLIHQREVGTDTQSFSHALRSALRQDANVIVVGELRDEETIRTAVTAADTGHLVIATLHTTDAPSAVSRIMDAYPEERQRFIGSQLASSMLGVVCQYLLPKREGTGLVLASELMVVNTGIAACIRDRRMSQIPGLMQIGAADGMHTVDDSLLELVLDKRISLPDALSYCTDQNYFRQQHEHAVKQKKRQSWFGRFVTG
ncbi:MAG: type IV pilus twitching motility protein PilT [Roseimicrobium sp.]